MYRVVLILTLSACVGAAQNQSPQEVLKHAIELHQAGDIEGAITEYRAFLKVHPEVGQVHSNLGAALARVGRYAEAITEYRLALKQDPQSPGILLNLGLAYYKTAQITKAAEQFATIHKIQPENRQAVFLLADCDLQLGENKKVIELISPLEQQTPDDKALIYLLGTALIRDQQLARGQVLVDRILREGDSAEARLLLGATKYYAHDAQGALADLKKAIELNPQLPDVYAYYGLMLLGTGDEAGAGEAFRQELKTNPNNFSANLELGVVLKQEEKQEEARKYFERALLVRPGDPAVRYQLATLDLAAGKLDESRRTLEGLVKESPQFTEAHVTLATIYYRQKRKADGDRERAIVLKLNEEKQAQQPGAGVR